MAIKSKSRQKKFDTRIDFTPMVDMNMLLITFFMLCTTMIKSQTLQIALPTNEKVEKEQQNKVKQSEAITIIIDGKLKEQNVNGKTIQVADPDEGMLFYYEGMPETANLAQGESNMKQAEFGSKQGAYDAIRGILQERNKEVVLKVNDLKKKWKENGFSTNDEKNDSIFQAERKKVMNDSTLKRPVVIIKATPNASYANVVSVLDEMQINSINRYQIDRINEVDSAMMIMVQAKNLKK
jgi:biopolymer transport protein ExbD